MILSTSPAHAKELIITQLQRRLGRNRFLANGMWDMLHLFELEALLNAVERYRVKTYRKGFRAGRKGPKSRRRKASAARQTQRVAQESGSLRHEAVLKGKKPSRRPTGFSTI